MPPSSTISPQAQRILDGLCGKFENMKKNPKAEEKSAKATTRDMTATTRDMTVIKRSITAIKRGITAIKRGMTATTRNVKDKVYDKAFFDGMDDEDSKLLYTFHLLYPDAVRKKLGPVSYPRYKLYIKSSRFKLGHDEDIQSVKNFIDVTKEKLILLEENIAKMPEKSEANIVAKWVDGISTNYVNAKEYALKSKKKIEDIINRLKKMHAQSSETKGSETKSSETKGSETKGDDFESLLKNSEKCVNDVLPNLKLFRTETKNCIVGAQQRCGSLINKVDAEKRYQTIKRRLADPFKQGDGFDAVKKYLKKNYDRAVELSAKCSVAPTVLQKGTRDYNSYKDALQKGRKMAEDKKSTDDELDSNKVSTSATEKFIESIKSKAAEVYKKDSDMYFLYVLGAFSYVYEEMVTFGGNCFEKVIEIDGEISSLYGQFERQKKSGFGKVKLMLEKAATTASQLGCYAGAITAVSGFPLLGLAFALIPLAGWTYNVVTAK